MRNLALLIACLGILAMVAIGVLLLEPERRGLQLPERVARPASDAVTQELEKSRLTLRRLEEDARIASEGGRGIPEGEALTWLFPLSPEEEAKLPADPMAWLNRPSRPSDAARPPSGRPSPQTPDAPATPTPPVVTPAPPAPPTPPVVTPAPPAPPPVASKPPVVPAPPAPKPVVPKPAVPGPFVMPSPSSVPAPSFEPPPAPPVASAPSPSGVPEGESLVGPGSELAPAPEPEPVADFQLSFIFFSPSFRRAVIDGRLVREGDWLPGGFRLVSIHDTSIVVRSDRTRQRIELPTVFPEPPIFMEAPAEPPSAPPVVAPPVAQPGVQPGVPPVAPRVPSRIPRIGPRAPQVVS